VGDLYTLALYKDGRFERFIRKGRSWSVVAYDKLSSAKRGLAHSLKTWGKEKDFGYEVKIIKADRLHIIEILK
jgi:hypothetical protein